MRRCHSILTKLKVDSITRLSFGLSCSVQVYIILLTAGEIWAETDQKNSTTKLHLPRKFPTGTGNWRSQLNSVFPDSHSDSVLQMYDKSVALYCGTCLGCNSIVFMMTTSSWRNYRQWLVTWALRTFRLTFCSYWLWHQLDWRRLRFCRVLKGTIVSRQDTHKSLKRDTIL